MRTRVEVLVIGGGIAGISAAARIAQHAETLVLESESALGYHSSGRSATFYHFGIGNDPVRAMTAASSDFFASPPADYAEGPLWTEKSALFIADQQAMPELEALHSEMDRFTDTIRRIGPEEMLGIVPVLNTGVDGYVAGLLDPGGRKLDADALLQANARAFRRLGGKILFDATVTAIARSGKGWDVETTVGSYFAEILVNAAGSWADAVAAMAGVRPLGVQPLRRTIIGFQPPADLDVSGWPFLKTVSEEGFYMLPDAGLLLASPMDVTPQEPCDAQPDDYDVALAAWRVEEATSLKIGRISTRWAGLRSFVADKVPTAGFAPDAEGFFWLAGQGGYGLQTSPAMAEAVESLMFDKAWPETLSAHGLRPEHIKPERLFH
ncbi:MAG: FAD-binding oxidoreductase [Sphingomonadales bacterium]|nr:MAG: FAD-binding oxidoreductase [Sphingomonadales bacterium]